MEQLGGGGGGQEVMCILRGSACWRLYGGILWDATVDVMVADRSLCHIKQHELCDCVCCCMWVSVADV